MKLLNEEQRLGIEHGIIESFKVVGIELSNSDKLIVNLTVKTTVDTIEQLLEKYTIVTKKERE